VVEADEAEKEAEVRAIEREVRRKKALAELEALSK